MERLFIQLSDKSQFKKMDPYDRFFGPGTHLTSDRKRVRDVEHTFPDENTHENTHIK